MTPLVEASRSSIRGRLRYAAQPIGHNAAFPSPFLRARR
jgi:hypothetical protein